MYNKKDQDEHESNNKLEREKYPQPTWGNIAAYGAQDTYLMAPDITHMWFPRHPKSKTKLIKKQTYTPTRSRKNCHR
ncbi:MAG: hypothetical protein PHN45_02170 [Methylococcales bacterium]|nr:hypothetical protein [Methylococcales bacterium]